MARFEFYLLAPEHQKEMLEQFFGAMASAKNKKEVEDICRDLFSPSEMSMFVRRIHAAILLQQGNSVPKTSEKLQASFGQVQRVRSALMRGGKGFKLIIKRKGPEWKQDYQKKYQDQPPQRPPFWSGGYWLSKIRF